MQMSRPFARDGYFMAGWRLYRLYLSLPVAVEKIDAFDDMGVIGAKPAL